MVITNKENLFCGSNKQLATMLVKERSKITDSYADDWCDDDLCYTTIYTSPNGKEYDMYEEAINQTINWLNQPMQLRKE